jgi:hypothetical protein
MHKILVIRLYFLLDALKSNHKNFVHLVGSYTYFKMMHGADNVKRSRDIDGQMCGNYYSSPFFFFFGTRAQCIGLG